MALTVGEYDHGESGCLIWKINIQLHRTNLGHIHRSKEVPFDDTMLDGTVDVPNDI